MEPRFELRCLGDPMLLSADGQPVRIRVRKHLALLIYLVVERGTRHRREHLADLLWPNLSENDGKHSVATAVTMLRAALGGEALDSNREGIQWSFSNIGLDLDRLASGDVLGDESGHGPLQVAPFLEGLEIPGATEYMLWRERQRASWLPKIRDALVVLMDRCRRTGDSRQIELMADRMLALDDLSEDAIRAKMEARAFAGDRLSALRIFESWKERLREELGAQPGALVEGMAVRLRKRGWERTTDPSVAAVRTEQWEDRPFIGRALEYRKLYEAWERTQKLEQGHAMVLGESGIGKSTLVERFSTAAGLEGASVSRVQCYELEREIPFVALGGLVHGLLDRPGASATSPDALSELSRAVPEIRKRYPNVAAPQPTEGETARYRIAEALHELVTCVADEHPLILVVDDYHLADDASLALLHILLRRLERQPVMLILAARSSDLNASPSAVRLEESLARFGMVSVELPPLTVEESEQLVTALLANEPRQPIVSARRALVRAGRGYPMVMELLCQDWLQHGEQSLALTMDAMTSEPSVSATPIEVIGQLYSRLVAALDPPTRNVLNLCSILGHRLNDASMYSLVDLTIGQTLSGCSQLTQLKVLRDSSAGLEFTNELIRAHAYLQIPSTMRRTLHAKIADRLIQAESDGEDIGGLEIAWHCYRGGKPDEATPYLLSGARRAMDRGAPLDADRALTSALPHLATGDERSALILLAEAKQEVGDWSQSLILLEELRELGGDSDLESSLVLRAEAELHLGQETFVRQPTTHQALREAVVSATIEMTRARAFAVLGALAYRGRDRQEARTLMALEERQGPFASPVATQQRFLTLAMLHALVGDLETGRQFAKKAVQLSDLEHLRSSRGVLALNGLGAINSAAGDFTEAIRWFTQAYRAAAALDNSTLKLRSAANLALSHSYICDWRKTVEWGEISLSLRGPTFGGHPETMSAYHTAFAYASIQRVSEAIELLNATDARLAAEAPTWLRQVVLLQRADVLWICGKRKNAMAAATQAIRSFGLSPLSVSYAGLFARWVAKLAGQTVDLADAKGAVALLVGELTTFDVADQLEILRSHQTLTIGQRPEAIDANRRSALAIDAQIRRLAAGLPSEFNQKLERLERR